MRAEIVMVLVPIMTRASFHTAEPDSFYHGEIGALRLARECGTLLGGFGVIGMKSIPETYHLAGDYAYGGNPPIEQSRWEYAAREAWMYRWRELLEEEGVYEEQKALINGTIAK